MVMMHSTVLGACAATMLASAAHGGGVASDTGLEDLIARLGAENTPTGAGVEVGHVEVETSGNYGPDTSHVELADKNYTFMSGTTGVSGHATQVARRAYGTGVPGIAPGVDTIWCYDTLDWLLDGFLRSSASSSTVPLEPPGGCAIFNNSWIASFGNTTNDRVTLRRADWSVDSDDVMIINGVANTGDHAALMAFMFNGISVGLQNGNHVADPVPSGFDLPGRQVPLIVAPQSTTSNATGVVTAATALIIETARTHPNTSGNFFATLSETIKVALLCGGRHEAGWSNGAVASGPERGRTSVPIDEVFGVGTVNVDRSWQVMAGGQHDGGSSPVGLPLAGDAGWDVATMFGGGSDYWRFDVPVLADEVSILLTWHQKANTGFGSYRLANHDLRLWGRGKGDVLVDLTGDAGLGVFGAGNVVSESDVDNIEHLYINDLAPGEYFLEVTRVDGAGGVSIYAVAWLFPEITGVAGDANGDGIVNILDIVAVLAVWGPCEGCVEDLNGDDVVNVLDLLEVIGAW